MEAKRCTLTLSLSPAELDLLDQLRAAEQHELAGKPWTERWAQGKRLDTRSAYAGELLRRLLTRVASERRAVKPAAMAKRAKRGRA